MKSSWTASADQIVFRNWVVGLCLLSLILQASTFVLLMRWQGEITERAQMEMKLLDTYQKGLERRVWRLEQK